jgi:hypothetical protein
MWLHNSYDKHKAQILQRKICGPLIYQKPLPSVRAVYVFLPLCKRTSYERKLPVVIKIHKSSVRKMRGTHTQVMSVKKP